MDKIAQDAPLPKLRKVFKTKNLKKWLKKPKKQKIFLKRKKKSAAAVKIKQEIFQPDLLHTTTTTTISIAVI